MAALSTVSCHCFGMFYAIPLIYKAANKILQYTALYDRNSAARSYSCRHDDELYGFIHSRYMYLLVQLDRERSRGILEDFSKPDCTCTAGNSVGIAAADNILELYRIRHTGDRA